MLSSLRRPFFIPRPFRQAKDSLLETSPMYEEDTEVK